MPTCDEIVYDSHQGLLILALHQCNRDCREGGASSHVHITAKPGNDGDDTDIHYGNDEDDNKDDIGLMMMKRMMTKPNLISLLTMST